MFVDSSQLDWQVKIEEEDKLPADVLKMTIFTNYFDRSVSEELSTENLNSVFKSFPTEDMDFVFA